MKDQYNRQIDYLRISVTDRCNLRCRYCMPEGAELVPMRQVLTYEEIARICAAAAALGIRKLKITGGEPLVRLGCPALIGTLKAIDGIEQVTMTTNGVLLEQYLPELLAAGLDAVNVSLDTLSHERFAAITGRDELDAVRAGLDAALASGLRTKVNAVLQRGMNDDEWLSLASLAKDAPLDVRFIEMMPIGFGATTPGVSNDELIQKLTALYPGTVPDETAHGNGPAKYIRVPGWRGSVGFISAIHGRFCDACNRVRLTARGKIKPCLCYAETADLLPLLRDGAPDEALKTALETAIYHKPKQHCFEDPDRITETARMASIGG